MAHPLKHTTHKAAFESLYTFTLLRFATMVDSKPRKTSVEYSVLMCRAVSADLSQQFRLREQWVWIHGSNRTPKSSAGE